MATAPNLLASYPNAYDSSLGGQVRFLTWAIQQLNNRTQAFDQDGNVSADITFEGGVTFTEPVVLPTFDLADTLPGAATYANALIIVGDAATDAGGPDAICLSNGTDWLFIDKDGVVS